MSGNAPVANVPPGQPQAAANTFGDINSLYNPYSTMQPLEYGNLLAMLNDPYSSSYLNSAGMAGDMYGTAAKQATGGAGLLDKNATDLYKMAFDPQNALFKQQQGLVQDQSNVTNSMYGLDNSAAGAGVANQNLSNFDINWQNNLLNRAESAAPLIGKDISGAQDLYGMGAQDRLMSGQLPYSTYGGIVGDVGNAINTYMGGASQGNDLTQNAIGDWLQYMGQGNSGVALNQSAYGMNQDAADRAGAGLYPLMYQGYQGLNNLWNSPSQPSTSTDWSMYGMQPAPQTGFYDINGSGVAPVGGGP